MKIGDEVLVEVSTSMFGRSGVTIGKVVLIHENGSYEVVAEFAGEKLTGCIPFEYIVPATDLAKALYL